MINEILREIKKVIERHEEIIFAYLYGSLAKGEKRKKSDIDIGIFLKEGFKRDVFYECQIALEIEKETKLKNVEVVVLNERPLRFLNQVLRYGKLISSKDEKRRVEFETFITKRYIDFRPYYDEYDKLRMKRLGI